MPTSMVARWNTTCATTGRLTKTSSSGSTSGVLPRASSAPKTPTAQAFSVLSRPHEGLVVVIIDEVGQGPGAGQKRCPDFLQTGEVHGPRGEVWRANLRNLVVFITTNGLRPLLEATLRRYSRVRMEYLPPNVEADILRKATGAPVGVIRLSCGWATSSRTAGETAVSLQECCSGLEDLPVAQSAAEVEVLPPYW